MDKDFKYNPSKDAIRIAQQLSRIADALEWIVEEMKEPDSEVEVERPKE